MANQTGNDLQGLEGPVVAVLVPVDALAPSGLLADVIRREKGHVRTDQGFRQVQQVAVAEETDPEGIARNEPVSQRFRGQIGMSFHQPVDMPVHLSNQSGGQDITHDDEAVPFVVVSDVLKLWISKLSHAV